MKQDRDSLVTFLGDERALDAVTPGRRRRLYPLAAAGRKADSGRVHQPGPSAEATIGRRIARCSQFFRAAVRKRADRRQTRSPASRPRRKRMKAASISSAEPTRSD